MLCISHPAWSDSLNTHIDLSETSDDPVGRFAAFWVERDHSISQQQAFDQYFAGDFQPSMEKVLTFGIGAPPVWVAFQVNNPLQTIQTRQLIFDKTWIDHIEVFIRDRQSGSMTQYLVGDELPFDERPQKTRTFQLKTHFNPGITDIMIHVKTADSMVLPIYLLTDQQQLNYEQASHYGYGLVYGYLLALLLYNATLFIGLRDITYLLYTALLASFMLGNIAYSGHGFMWLWPDSVSFQLWGQSLLMNAYAISGLLFALYFLDIRAKSLMLFRIIIASILMVIAISVLTILTHQATAATVLSFSSVSSYMLIATALGIYAYIKQQPNSKYFLSAITLGSLGTGLAALSASGIIPFNEWLFHAAEIGMLAEATLLALALSNRIRTIQERSALAEKLADTDLLTQLNNRRGFFKLIEPVWNNNLRHQHPSCVIIFDLDDFKSLNDTYGHECGDIVLKTVGQLLQKCSRKGDVAARWGGEEFLIFLPETTLQQARLLAERLRQDIANAVINYQQQMFYVTASFGLAENRLHQINVENLIAQADAALYYSKDNGKNQVSAFNEISDQLCQTVPEGIQAAPNQQLSG